MADGSLAIIGPDSRKRARTALCPSVRTESAGTVGAQHAAPLPFAGEVTIRIQRSRRAAATTAPIPVRRSPDLATGRHPVTPTRRRRDSRCSLRVARDAPLTPEPCPGVKRTRDAAEPMIDGAKARIAAAESRIAAAKPRIDAAERRIDAAKPRILAAKPL